MSFEYDDISDDELEKELKMLEEEAINGMRTTKNKNISANVVRGDGMFKHGNIQVVRSVVMDSLTPAEVDGP
ncbi:hypothetical protein KIN20_019766 [Parelaphostrongylus tenuis]|uniref:Uncharacterized protein n=1 Tax=Parelaphostrongylus tenuis TaxID=148309 RepID=A0AAD5MLM0_PARTN|nr:hypothetical protein KIN20_019766 [Parelaphostrongylus tenuis]